MDRDEAAHARAADADPPGVDPVARREEARHPADVGERLRRHLVVAVAVPALVVGERRPARGRRRRGRSRRGSPSREPAPWTITIAGHGGGGVRAARAGRAARRLAALARRPAGRVASVCASPGSCGPRRVAAPPGARSSQSARTMNQPTTTRRRPDRGLGRLPARQPRQRARPPRGRRLRRGRARARVRHARPTSTPRTTSAPAARAYLDAFARPRRRLRGHLREQGGADHRDSTGCCARRGSRSTSPRAASCTWRCAPASTRRGSTCTATTRPRPSCGSRSRPASAT